MNLEAPFPYFGGKRRVADVVWKRFGDVPNYCEPFFGSGAVLLNRPHEPRIETVNDKDGFVANFWRAVQHDPEQTALYADNPVNENDLHARHSWLVRQRESLVARLEGDPEFYDAKIAGWWVWGICCWIGAGFCSGEGPWQVEDGQLVHLGNAGMGVNRQLVHLGNAGMGVNRQLVHLRDAGMGVNRQSVHLRSAGMGVKRKLVRLGGAGGGVGVVKSSVQASGLIPWFTALAERLANVRVCSGDWTRVMGPFVTFKHGLTGVFLDPPYAQDGRDPELYNHEDDVSAAVRLWAIENGDNPLLRIALCGYEGEHEMPAGWAVYEWEATGGYGAQRKDGSNENGRRERIWFSPHCLKPELRPSLFDLMEAPK